MPDAVEECVRSVLADNPEYSENRAYAICNAMRNRGELSISDNPSHDELLTAAAGQDIDCPEGHVHTGSQCVPVEEVRDVPPSLLSAPTQFALEDIDTEPIERTQEDNNTVRYSNIKLLSPGVWTDSASRETVWYSPRGMKNLEIAEDNVVNIMHDADNDVSNAGSIDPESVHADDDGVYADLLIDTSDTAGEYADKNLQKTLETEGAKGFGGPSVEISADGQEIEYNNSKGMKELVGGIIDGLGLVKNPASKPVSFARQTAKRGVALSSDQEVMVLKSEQRDMADAETYREVLESNGIDTGEMTDDEVMSVYEDLMDAGGSEEEPEMQEGEEEEETEEESEGENEGEDETEEEDEDMDMGQEEMAQKIQSLEERLTNLEDMAEQAMAAEDVEETLSEELEGVTEELASAETVQELEEAKEELDKRLSELEDKPENPKSLSEDADGEVPKNVTPMGQTDTVRNTYSR